MTARRRLRTLGGVATLLAAAMLCGCGGGTAPVATGAISPPAGLELPQEAVPPGVKPMTREVEEIAGQ